MLNKNTLTFLAVTLIISGCGSESTKETKIKPPVSVEQKKTVSVVSKNIIARVNGSVITREELTRTLLNTLGKEQASSLGRSGRRKAIESLVVSRVIAQTSEKELSVADLASVEKEVAAYREKLLVSRYLKKHVNPRPVSEETINTYYKNNPARFGGKTVREYEMIFAAKNAENKNRDELINQLGKAAQKKNWKKIASKLKKRGYSVEYRKGKVNKKLFQDQLYTLMESLKNGTSSPVTFIKGKPYIVRIISEKENLPRPLRELRAEIRRTLVPVQLKKAIKQLSENLLKKAEIEYIETI